MLWILEKKLKPKKIKTDRLAKAAPKYKLDNVIISNEYYGEQKLKTKKRKTKHRVVKKQI